MPKKKTCTLLGSQVIFIDGRARKIRTSECLGQSQMPYRLAIALSTKDYTLFYGKKKREAMVFHRLLLN